MACDIGFWHHSSGITGLSVAIYGLSSGGIVNGAGGDALAEAQASTRPRFYSASMTEAASGIYKALVLQGGVVVYDGLVRLQAGQMCVIDAGTETRVAELLPDALAQLTDATPVSITWPTLLDQHLSTPLVRGDCYLHAHGRALTFSRSDFPDLTGLEQVTLTARNLSDPSLTFSLTGEVAVTTGVKVLRIEATSAQTLEWSPGKYEFDVEVRFPDDNAATFVGPNVFLRVLEDVG